STLRCFDPTAWKIARRRSIAGAHDDRAARSRRSLTPQSQRLANRVANRLQRIVLGRLRIEHPVVTNPYCQTSVRVGPADRTARTRMRDSMRIAANHRRRRRRFAAQMESTAPEVEHASQYPINFARVSARRAE